MTTKTAKADTATAIDDRVGRIETAIEQLAALVTNMAVEQATQTVGQPADPSKGDTPRQGYKIAKGATAPPLSGKAKSPKTDEPDARTVDLEGPVTYKQLRCLAGITAPALDGQRIAYMGPEGSAVREYWAFLTKQEASDAISTLKGTISEKVGKQAFEFSNGLTIAPR